MPYIQKTLEIEPDNNKSANILLSGYKHISIGKVSIKRMKRQKLTIKDF
jgi:hypothetical protein